MFAANRENQIGAFLAPALCAKLHQLAHTIGIQRVKRVLCIDALLHIGRHKSPRVVARQTIGHLREVIGAKAKEMTVRRDLFGAQCAAREAFPPSRQV